MGLDMFLHGRKMPHGLSGTGKRYEDGFEITYVILELAYWRKHPDLHGYIVQTYAKGVDECQEIGLSPQFLMDIIQAVENDELPHTEGFFFGQSGPEDKEPTLKLLREALTWVTMEVKGEWRDIYYKASW